MAASNLTIRLDSELKDDAARIVEHYGLDLSTAVRAFFTEIVNTNSIPLSFDYEHPNTESQRAIQETAEMIAAGSGKTYTSGRELIEAALA
ncbi:type II toxin-antitoxin system RelB/DinJ family antitoxin [Mobiluncus mulieris]|uniref:type II toxin-antitoxin system RelB/DinJ family antitoxin n=1 Tax=Mobiluncus mulieris TaxID=2052 RepID=UPI00019F94B3|nr:type II toxin-antitoxin system RelB/DinJ family antitoxin [Mobiluncus mulieris]EEJ54579.1 addiction module antitoxin, RelB/DinJ family [Mobiluncus mulieris ATCC 35243]MCV0002222.1 type II toxin-antitoxin system RelB/DinJ family antitoxin [Mobiluncus mulieris]SPX76539.1 bifunctional antitoxin/transcriptional repressor RelB [Mobiluncus mulieris]